MGNNVRSDIMSYPVKYIALGNIQTVFCEELTVCKDTFAGNR